MNELNSPEAEMAVVGAILSNNREHERVAAIVRDQDFSDQALATIWQEADAIIRAGRPATWQTVSQSLEAEAEGEEKGAWRDYCYQLQAAAMPEYAEQQANIIRSLADLRRISERCQAGIEVAASDPTQSPAEIAANIAGDLSQIGNGLADWRDAGDVGIAALADLEKKTTVYPTGLEILDDRMMGGIYPGKFYGIAARMKSGKSMMICTLAYNMAFSDRPPGMVYVTLEMSPEEMWRRCAARHMGINEGRLATAARRNDWDMVQRGYEANHDFKQRGLNFLGRPGCTLNELRTIIARAGMSPHIQGVFVDYIQLLTGQSRGQSRAEFLDEAAQMMASMARKYNIWIVAAAQLNREGEVRGSDGLLNACDMGLYLHKVEQDGSASVWIEMRASRYTPAKDIGDQDNPPYLMDFQVGPHFREV